MVEGLFKELTEDQIAYEQREREFKGMLDRNTAIYAAGLEGEKRGEKRVNALYSRLMADGRMEDMKKAMEDAEFREALYKELKI